MNPFEPTPATLHLDYLLMRFSAGEATPKEYAQLQEHIAGDPDLAALVEKQRAEFTAAFPDYQRQKAAGFARLQEAMGEPTPKPTFVDVFIDKMKEAARGIVEDVQQFVQLCNADALRPAHAGARPVLQRMQFVKHDGGITVKLVSDSGGLGISAKSSQPTDAHAVVEIGYGPLEPARLRDFEALPDPGLSTPRVREIIQADGTTAKVIVLARLMLKPGKEDVTRFTDAAQVSRSGFALLDRGTYYVSVARNPGSR